MYKIIIFIHTPKRKTKNERIQIINFKTGLLTTEKDLQFSKIDYISCMIFFTHRVSYISNLFKDYFRYASKWKYAVCISSKN